MRKINSIGFGPILLIAIGLLLAVIPGLLYLFRTLLNSSFYRLAFSGSLILGGFLLLIFLILLTIELCQDRRLNRYYAENQNRMLTTSTGKRECQACGNTQLEKDDTFCPVCGVTFDPQK